MLAFGRDTAGQGMGGRTMPARAERKTVLALGDISSLGMEVKGGLRMRGASAYYRLERGPLASVI